MHSLLKAWAILTICRLCPTLMTIDRMNAVSHMVKRISIEGNLAAGKSTLLSLLELLDSTHLYEIAPEPVA